MRVGNQYRRDSDNADDTSDSEVIGRGAVDYTFKLNAKVRFEQDLSFESGADNTYIESVTELHSTLVGELAVVASFTVRHNTTVPSGLSFWTMISTSTIGCRTVR